MKRLYAIIAVVSVIAMAVIALALMTFRNAVAGERPQGPMQICTAKWREAQQKTTPPPHLDASRLVRSPSPESRGGSGYKAFLRQCLNAAPAGEPAKTAGHPGNRMKICGAKWRDAKTSNATHGQTWRQFSSACLKGG